MLFVSLLFCWVANAKAVHSGILAQHVGIPNAKFSRWGSRPQHVDFALQWNIALKPIFHCDAKPFALSPGIGLDPQLHNFALGIPTCWYLKTLKFALPPTGSVKFATQNPKASQWNIGCVRFHIGCVHFMLFVLISFALVTQRELSLQWNMGLKHSAFVRMCVTFFPSL